MFDGILIIDKPEGITSHDVVARCRRILKTKRIGHTGTLDPFATGVVVVLVGKATRLAQFLGKDVKEYEAVVQFGFETDTGDRTGKAKKYEISNFKSQISNEEIEAALKDFRGEIMQTPPMYSAKKVEGKKLYELARKGIEIERKPVKINIHELRLNETLRTPHFAFRISVTCSAGTYIRVLAEDIGKKIGVGAHLAELRRTRAGNFTIEKAVSLEELEKLAADEKISEVLVSMNEAISFMPEVKLNEAELNFIKTGRKIFARPATTSVPQNIRLTDAQGDLVAVGICDGNQIQPRIVF